MKHLLANYTIKSNRIALLICNLERGGMQRVAVNLGELFARNGYEVFYFVESYDKKRSFSHNGKVVKIYSRIDMSNKTKELNSYFCDAYNLRKLKKKYNIKYTISFAPEMNLLNIFSGIGEKQILTIHNCTSMRDDVHSLAYQKKFIWLGNFATKVIAVCNWCKEDLHNNFGIHNSKIEVIYNQAPNISDFNLKKRENIILCVGRLEEIKRQWHVLKAFKSIEKELVDYKLCFVGDGEYETKLKKLTDALDLNDKVEFVGYKSSISSLYTRAKVLVLTSKSEAFPCVAVEAMAHGLPIVAFDIPGGLSEAMGASRKPDRYPLDAEAGIITEYCKCDSKWEDIGINSQEQMLGKEIYKLLSDNVLYDKKVNGALKMCRVFDRKLIEQQWLDLLEERI